MPANVKCALCGWGRLEANTKKININGVKYTVCRNCQPIFEKIKQILGEK